MEFKKQTIRVKNTIQKLSQINQNAQIFVSIDNADGSSEIRKINRRFDVSMDGRRLFLHV